MTAAARFERAARQAQADGRIPALSVALHRADREPWVLTVGESGNPDHPLGPDTRFRIGSVTKTFTAVLVMQARDEGLLDLDEPISAYLDVPAHGDATPRRLLSHTAGFQREPAGDVWDTLVTPDAADLLAQLDQAERVLPNARRFHYSNLGFAVLGHLVAKLHGTTWEQLFADRIGTPLGLTATTADRPAQAAVGYLVDEYSDAARPEPQPDLGGVGPAAQLWSTATDMARWASFLVSPQTADPDGKVLAAATLEEMRWPLTPREETVWASGFGLGLLLAPQARRAVHVGHDGAMPGFLAGVYGRRGDGAPDGLGCAVLGSSGTAGQVNELVHELLRIAVDADPAEIKPWRPAPPAPREYRSALGVWWSEGGQFVFSWHEGALQARAAGVPADRPPAVFRPLPDRPDVLRTVSGREAGEQLRLTRDEHGVIVRMHWATYRFTRVQEAFDGGAAWDGNGD
ncbi:beta-lactamase family protein [Actinoplanes sp. KI2]|uniref:serine hydrolase domain-containing protein n=1 Tax=Actinoplanes sp. KI2 TaxID=2983315 RepID=UPI0021D5F649|nr:serine hydrolase domain-containing protein [Actinoplanes sp. KI2]MCU7728779.1 beta-lactamase family protein [Actinoplanes sp. KI2]